MDNNDQYKEEEQVNARFYTVFYLFYEGKANMFYLEPYIDEN